MTMEGFKAFLESKGPVLSRTTEFLPFYALPYLPDPRVHPSFKEIFTASWVEELKAKVDDFLNSEINVVTKPKLFEMFDELKLLQDRVVSQAKEHKALQMDYKNLLAILQELLSSVAETFQGKPITPAYLSDVIHRLSSVKRHNTSHGQPFASPYRTSSNVILKPENLDFRAIKRDLELSANNFDYFKRLVKARPFSLRRQVLELYVKNDILGFKSNTIPVVASFLSHSDSSVKEQTAKLLNLMSSDWMGREYLLSKKAFIVPILVSCFKAEATDTEIRQNILGVLQKLSLRRSAQSAMNQQNLIAIVLNMLNDLESLSEYSVEYGVALLMNLCLRTSGKKQCAENPTHVLKVLNMMIEHENLQVKTYVNGTLYSILSETRIRDQARAMGMLELLKLLRNAADELVQRQVDYVIDQLNSDSVDDSSDTLSEDGEEDDYEDDIDEEEEPFDESEMSEEMQPFDGEVIGEALLEQKYQLTNTVSPVPPLPNNTRSIPPPPNFRPPLPTQTLTPVLSNPIDSLTRPQTPNARPRTPRTSVERTPGSIIAGNSNLRATRRIGSAGSMKWNNDYADASAQLDKALVQPEVKLPPPPRRQDKHRERKSSKDAEDAVVNTEKSAELSQQKEKEIGSQEYV
ncbi:hypothetical protein BKA69DRAFT_1037040 [Paraphysoderma sedebokerense]|nr:hypothetical protein BKA69DRAFT_1037040 [Paraphysoderma sedebokerense]